MRDSVMLKCTVCGEENYLTSRNKKNVPERLELKNIAHGAKK